MNRRLMLVPALVLLCLGSASGAFGQVIFSMDYSPGAYPNGGWTAWPTNASWSRSFVTGAGPSGQNVVEMRQLSNPSGGDYGGQFNWGWSGNIEPSDPAPGARRYYRWRQYFTTGSNFQGLAWGDGNPGDITNKLLLVGQGCTASPCRVILTYRTDRANQRVGYFRLQIDGGAQLVDTGPYAKGQWLNIQVELQSGSSGGYKIWINNNDYANPTAQKTGITLNSQNWKYVWLGGFNNDGLQAAGVHTWRQTDFQAATAFNSTWNSGGSSTPAPTPAPTACSFAASPTSASIPAAGGTGQVSVSTSPSGCSPASWTASSNSSFVTVTSGASGSGTGTVRYSVAPNTGASRTATLTVAGRAVSITQGGPSQTAPAPTNTRLPFSSTFDGGTFSEWNGFRNTTGATITSQGCQSGSCLRSPLIAGTTSDNYGDLYFGDFPTVGGTKVEEAWLRLYSKFDSGLSWPNRGQKIAILNLTDGVSTLRRYQVTLYVNPSGQYALEQTDIDNWIFTGIANNVGSPAAVRLGQWDKLKVHVKLNTPGASNGVVQLWVNDQLKIDQTALNIRKGTSYGMGKLNLSTYSTESNPTNGVQWHDSLTLSATDPESGSTPTPTPTPCSFAVSPTSVSVAATGQTGQLTVAASPAGCSPSSWTASSSGAFVTLAAGTSGSGNGTVTYAVAANTGSSRTATLTVAGKAVAVTQAGAAVTPPSTCTVTLTPTAAAATAAGGQGQVAVTVGPAGCSPASWAAASSSAFLAITGGASGSGSGVVSYGVAANTGAGRTATITVAGRVFTLTQAGTATGTATGLPWSSTFDSGDTSEWDGFRNTTGATVVTEGCVSGRCLQTPLLAGTTSDNYGEQYFGDFVSVGGPKVEEVWLALSSRFDTGMRWPNVAQRIAILGLTDGASWTRRYSLSLFVNPSGQYALQLADHGSVQYWAIPLTAGASAAVRLGQWDRLKLRVRLNTPGASNGIVQMWVNDQLVADHANVNVRGDTSYGINKLNLSTFATDASPASAVQRHDELVLGTTDPDIAPAKPLNVRVMVR